MSEFRHNLITNQWVILAPARGGRPYDFSQSNHTESASADNCPFCAGRERMTPPEVYAIRPEGSPPDGPGWLVRVIPNKYPALRADLPPQPIPADFSDHPELSFCAWSGAGVHEVVIEAPEHDRHFARLAPAHAVCALAAVRQRYRALQQAENVKIIGIFINHGGSAGASLSHPHFQIIAPDLLGGRLADQLHYYQEFQRRQGRGVFEITLEQELAAGSRVIAADEHFVALCPCAARTPYEVYVLPRASQAHFSDLADTALPSLAEKLQLVLGRLERGMNNPDYNLVLHSAPAAPGDYPGFRWFVQIAPRLSIRGGFELSTHIYVNTIAPEEAAAFYRQP